MFAFLGILDKSMLKLVSVVPISISFLPRLPSPADYSFISELSQAKADSTLLQ
jgi:hypothetical protein